MIQYKVTFVFCSIYIHATMTLLCDECFPCFLFPYPHKHVIEVRKRKNKLFWSYQRAVSPVSIVNRL